MSDFDEKALAHRKPCSICSTPRDVLIRCQIDESGEWHFVCPGMCWKDVSGGVIDGDAQHEHYRYGGMWKNKHAGVSAKIPRKLKGKMTREAKAKERKEAHDENDAHADEGEKSKVEPELRVEEFSPLMASKPELPTMRVHHMVHPETHF